MKKKLADTYTTGCQAMRQIVLALLDGSARRPDLTTLVAAHLERKHLPVCTELNVGWTFTYMIAKNWLEVQPGCRVSLTSEGKRALGSMNDFELGSRYRNWLNKRGQKQRLAKKEAFKAREAISVIATLPLATESNIEIVLKGLPISGTPSGLALIIEALREKEESCLSG